VKLLKIERIIFINKLFEGKISIMICSTENFSSKIVLKKKFFEIEKRLNFALSGKYSEGQKPKVN